MRLFTFQSATPRVALHNVPNGQSSISKIPLQSRGKVLGPKSPNFQHFPTFQNAAVCIGLSVYSVLVISSKLKDLLDSPDQFADFTSLADLTKQNNNAIAVCVFFSWIKLFKYISFNKTMTQLSSTLSRVSKYFLPYFWALFKSLYCLTFLFLLQCAGDVLGFAVMFFIVFFAFAQLGFLLFGTQVSYLKNSHFVKIDWFHKYVPNLCFRSKNSANLTTQSLRC